MPVRTQNLCNSGNQPFNSVVQKAWNMFTSQAYVHQYLKFGLTEDHFVDSFAATEQIIKNYSSL